eukprot:CAMPEP_0117050704 /NCGR_PEP_ID=MMETSP0472-20121206/35007_1 /TAXON_ID=693140 ORGANISM="Tiarina fusus, Strain LIS" /NCGR_SAMPLE_ID=MMETSP0472 /ASSEMBLY_ACC=CAM_ASM_000603 /LENGTH=189 /DNA_ID=CAMNT_0004764585 /DNA_START=316 /DNA_END=885 /DNA_ORIENTATION=+
MVLGSAMCALNLASSAMVNGVCCMYQMQEEEERQKAHHDAIKRSIRSEYERNRKLDMEQRLREKEMTMYTLQLSEARRRNLMAKKTSLNCSSQKSCPTSCREQPIREETSASSSRNVDRRRFEFADSTDGSLVKKVSASRRSNSMHRPEIGLSHSSVYSDSPEMKMSSLLDSDVEDDDEGEEFEEIVIE